MKRSIWFLFLFCIILGLFSCGGGGGGGTALTTQPSPQLPTAVTRLDAVTPTSTLPTFSSSRLANFTSNGYVLEEYTVSGKANVYDWLEDGSTPIQAGKQDAPYTTRIIVLKPSNPKNFTGRVIVEVDAYTYFGTLAQIEELIMKRGWAYVGVTAKPYALNQLKTFNATRYAALSMATPKPLDDACKARLTSDYPADSEEGLCWDILAQIGTLLKTNDSKNPFSGYTVKYVYMTGVSQGGMYITTFMNAGFHAKAVTSEGKPAYDGYIMVTGHGRIKPINQCADPVPLGTPRAAFKGIAPFIILATESDANAFDALKNRREDSDKPGDQFRLYEITGSVHAGVPSNPAATMVEPIPNDFPFVYFVRGAFVNLDNWVANGTPPPKADRILFVNTQTPEPDVYPLRYGVSLKDQFGNSIGGVRSPYVDVPIATYNCWYTAVAPIPVPSGTPGGATTATKGWLFGHKIPFEESLLRDLYGSHTEYVSRFVEATNKLIKDGWVTPEDGQKMIADAALTPILDGESIITGTIECRNLTKLVFKDKTFGKTIAIKSAELVEASGSLPTHCDVTASIWPEIEFRIKMPVGKNWNKKLYYNGGGGYDGSIPNLDTGLGKKDTSGNYYASAGTNGGHTGSPADFYATPQNANAMQKIKDFGYRAHYEGSILAKRIIEAFYGGPPARSYWVGCSNGGREGMIMAQRYPDIFDGYVIGAPALSFFGTTLSGNWRSQVAIGDTILYAPSYSLNPLYALSDQSLTGTDYVNYVNTKMQVLANVVMAQCDGLDGVMDGLISNPEKCTFVTDYTALNNALQAAGAKCSGNVDSANCFTNEQVESLVKIYRGPTDSVGNKLLFGFYAGAEPTGFNIMARGMTSGWYATIIGAQPGLPGDSLHYYYYQYMAFDPPLGPSWDWKTFDFDKDPQRVVASGIIDIIDATDTNLWGVYLKGAKIIMWHGTGDGLISAQQSTDYYNKVISKMGETITRSFFKYYMVPGVFHCAGGYGCGTVDWLSYLENWVEKKVEPDVIIGTGTYPVARTRPLCQYPKVAKYKGTGDVNSADNFSCEDP